MNETLRRALLRAGLSEADVAAYMAVDPKTVRRWTEGRIPYMRHRWELARVLGCDERDLWPQVLATRSRPADVYAIYPRRDSVPADVWRNIFASAEREIDILAVTGMFIASKPAALAALDQRAAAGVRLRICLLDPDAFDHVDNDSPALGREPGPRQETALALYGTLRAGGAAEIRLHGTVLNNCIYRADDELLVSHLVYGVPPGQIPVLHLCRADDELIVTYLEAFERIWAGARAVD